MILQFCSAVFGRTIYVSSGLFDGSSVILRLNTKYFVPADRHSPPPVPPLPRSYFLRPPP